MIQLNPKFSRAFELRGLSKIKMGKPKEGKKVLSKVYKSATPQTKPIAVLFLGKINPSDFISHAGKNPYAQSAFRGFLGEYHLVRRDKKKARESFRKCIALDPSCRNIPCRFSKTELKRL